MSAERVVRSDGCIQKLQPGEVKRTPKTKIYLGGYYVACPACGLVQAITADEQEFIEEIDDVTGAEVLTMRPGYKCDRSRCKKTFRFERDVITVT